VTPELSVEREPATFTITREEPGDSWNEFVHRAPDGCYTQLSGWRTVLNDALGHETVHLVARGRDNIVAGALSMAWVRSPIVGRYLVSMPFLDNGGPIGDDDARSELALAAAEEARRGNADLLELRTRRACRALSMSNRKLTVCLQLSASSDAQWQRFPSKLRSQIKRPRDAGFTTKFGAAERHPFYEIYARHMRDLGSPALGKRLFDRLADVFPNLVEFAVVYDPAGRPVSGGCGFKWRDKFDLVWAASLRSANKSSPNMLLYWSFMERCIAQGHMTFDFGRCTSGSGTHRFKRQWGGEDVALPWTQWSSRGVTAPPTAARPHYAAAAAIWRRLPPMITRACGPSLARLIP
jgi:serine/alanine adding enzyme